MTRIERTDVRTKIVIELVGGDLRVRGHSSNEVLIEGDNPEIAMQSPDSPLHIRCGGDCELRMPETLPLAVQQVGGEAKITNLQDVVTIGNIGSDLVLRHLEADITVGQIGNDCVAKHIEGDLKVSLVGNDMVVQQVDGDVVIDNVGNDLVVRDIGGSCQCAQVGKDINLEIEFERGNTYSFQAGNAVVCVITPDIDAVFVLPRQAEIAVDKDALEATIQLHNGTQKIVVGEGGPEIVIQAKGFSLSSNRQARGFNFEFDFDTQIGDLERQINESLSGLGQMIETRTQQAINQATEFARNFSLGSRGERVTERIRREAERVKRHVERDTERARRRANRMQRHAERMQRYSRRRGEGSVRSEPISNDERLMILKMVQEGRLSVEEAEQLLRTMEGHQ
jgi:hypothetical protein